MSKDNAAQVSASCAVVEFPVQTTLVTLFTLHVRPKIIHITELKIYDRKSMSFNLESCFTIAHNINIDCSTLWN